MNTRSEILAEAGGDPWIALDLACTYYDRARQGISAGYWRANTSHLSWNAKPPPNPVLLPSEDSPNG